MLQVLREQLARPISELDLTDWQKSFARNRRVYYRSILKTDEGFSLKAALRRPSAPVGSRMLQTQHLELSLRLMALVVHRG